MPPGWLSIPGHVRTGQPRTYPSVTLADPRVIFSWHETPDPVIYDCLDNLLSRLTRLGHSSSLVSCRLSDSTTLPPDYVPSERGEVVRSIRKGQLESLEFEHAQHQGSKPRTLPFTAIRYRSRHTANGYTSGSVRPDTAGQWQMFEFLPASRRLPSTRTAEIAKVLRATLFSYAEDPLPEGLTGHRHDGTPSSSPHVGFLPLPHIGHEHADGRLMGVAIAIPDSIDGRSHRSVLRAIGTWEATHRVDRSREVRPWLYLKLGRGGRIAMIRQVAASDLVALRPKVWRGPSAHWVSATPVALPTHPGVLGKGTATARAKAWRRAEKGITAACQHVGLPEPKRVSVSFEPFIHGVRPAQHFPAFRQGDRRGRGVARRLVHASVTFAEPIAGPLVLGAGRYLGLGLMRPVDRHYDD